MEAYPGGWLWTNGIVQERARMLLPGDAMPWRVRVLENRYPAVMPFPEAPPPGAAAAERPDLQPGSGRHELILLSHLHRRSLPDMSLAEAALVVEAIQGRWREHRGQPGTGAVHAFLNHGAAAGASQAHPHAQVIASEQVPERLRRMAERAGGWPGAHQVSLHHHLLKDPPDSGEGSRQVFSTGEWRAALPFAPVWPWEAWVLPESPESCFADLEASQCAALAGAVQRLLRLLARALGGEFPFNLIFVLPPVGMPDQAGVFPWHVRITPRLHIPGGYDLNSGIQINPVGPEEAAARLRDLSAESGGGA